MAALSHQNIQSQQLPAAQRLAVAHEVLALAEERSGVRTASTRGARQESRIRTRNQENAGKERHRSGLRMASLSAVRSGIAEPGIAESGAPEASASAVGANPAGMFTAGTRLDRTALPVLAPLRVVLPHGLPRGSVIVAHGSTFAVLSMLVQASVDGSWIAVVGAPDLNYVAVHDIGIVLERTVAIPYPEDHAAKAIAALLEGLDIIFVGAHCVLRDGEKRTLLARARERGAVIVSQQDWPGARCILTGEGGTWSGLAGIGKEGLGRLRERSYTLSRIDHAGGNRRCTFAGVNGVVQTEPVIGSAMRTKATEECEEAAPFLRVRRVQEVVA